jgi:hypothetical protein
MCNFLIFIGFRFRRREDTYDDIKLIQFFTYALLGRGEIEKREIKTRKPMHVLGLTLVQIHALISVFLFLSSQFLSYQA